jgi:hypothetical protein
METDILTLQEVIETAQEYEKKQHQKTKDIATQLQIAIRDSVDFNR